MGREKVAADDAAIGLAEHRMYVEGRLSFGHRDIAEQRQDLHLLVDGNPSVFFRLPIEIAEHRIEERTDAGDRRCLDFLFMHEPGQ